jgi:hypothetical protein
LDNFAIYCAVVPPCSSGQRAAEERRPGTCRWGRS